MATGPVRRAQRVVVVLTLVVGLVGAAPLSGQSANGGQEGDERFDGVRRMIEAVMAERGLASVSVAAARDGRIVWEEAFGWADRESRIEATPHTLYSLASISKPFTATGLMVLVERGIVDLDRPVDDYLGTSGLTGLGGSASEATVRRVLSHTAGLPLHYQFFYEGSGYGPPPRAETIRRYGIVAHPPGTEFHYSNLGFGIVDHVISRTSRRAYEDFMRSEVFVPLGLTHTSVGLDDVLRPQAAVRYDGEHRRIPFYDFDHAGASAVWSSAHDLVRFGLFHLGHPPEGSRPLLRPEILASMRHRETPEGDTGYGLGWFIDDEFGYRKEWHTGSMPGVSTMLALYPELDVVVVVLLNDLARDLRVSISQEIVAVLDDGYARAREQARSTSNMSPGGSAEESTSSAFRPPDGLVGTWRGTLRTWEDELPMELTVSRDGDVHVRVAGQLEVVLNDAQMAGVRLQGRYAGRIPTPDVMRHPHSIFLDVRLEGDRLYGQASAQTDGEPEYYSLASYVDLRQVR